ncbi:ABC transporter substrate-binding protein [Reinekea marinisedimentorum]|nr:ABC transporter substrate binding protein [Reinekea marinisedimentorum]
MIGTCAYSAERQTILVIQSYHAEYLWDKSYLESLRSSLGAGYDVITFEMDTKRLPESQFAKQADAAWKLYKKLKPDLVVLGDDNALKFLGEKLGRTKTPVVYLGINNDPANYNIADFDNLTGILERPLLKRSISLISEIMPVNKLLIMFDSGTTAQTVLEQTFENSTTYTLGNVQADIFLMNSFDDWKRAVQQSRNNGYDALIIGLYQTLRDENNNHVSADDVLAWTDENTPIPPFSFWDFSVRSAHSIGGYVLHGEQQGLAAGIMIKSILSGVKPALIYPITADRGGFLFSRSQISRWGIELPDYITSNASFVD